MRLPIEKVTLSCECNHWCGWVAEVDYKEALENRRNGYVLIVEGCPFGAEPTDVFVEKRNGYSVYHDPFDSIAPRN